MPNRGHHKFCKLNKVCSSSSPKIWWQTSVQDWSVLFDCPTFWINLKEKFFLKIENFLLQTNSRQYIIYTEKVLKKSIFKKNFLLYWISLLYITDHSVAKKFSYFLRDLGVYRRFFLSVQNISLFIEYITFLLYIIDYSVVKNDDTDIMIGLSTVKNIPLTY